MTSSGSPPPVVVVVLRGGWHTLSLWLLVPSSPYTNLHTKVQLVSSKPFHHVSAKQQPPGLKWIQQWKWQKKKITTRGWRQKQVNPPTNSNSLSRRISSWQLYEAEFLCNSSRSELCITEVVVTGGRCHSWLAAVCHSLTPAAVTDRAASKLWWLESCSS